jgi:hypothetical protein
VRSLQLQAALTAFVEQAARSLQEDVLDGQEVPFELETRTARMRGASLYCYRPLTASFIAERFAELRRVEAYALAASLLDDSDTPERYLVSRGADPPRRGERRADAALLALLQDVFDELTDFDAAKLAQQPERLERALQRLDGSSLPATGQIALVATLRGLAIASPEIKLTRGLSIARPDAVRGAPEQALRACEQGRLLVLYTAETHSPGEGVAEGVEVVCELLRALRLFGDGRISLGSRAFARMGDGRWSTLALGSASRPHGMLLVCTEQEDELRGFCNLVSRRSPHASSIAWALRRFELGCDRASEYEGLSDHLLALRALLGEASELEPGGAPDGLLAGRLAALCATPERCAELSERTLAAISLEREAIAGTAVEHAGGLALARELADHLRALLRDVICGHLQADLAALADRLLLGEQEGAIDDGVEDSHHVRASGPEQLALCEQQLGDEREPSELLRVAV